MAKTALKYYKNADYHLEIVRNFYKSFMESMIKPQNNQLSVMDIGIGGGRIFHEVLLPLLPKNVSEIVGVDIENDMVEFCRSMNSDPKITFEKLDIVDEDIPKHLQNRFNMVFSSYCFSYVKDLRQGFRNSGRLLKPQGEILNLFQYKTNALYTTYRRMAKMGKWSSLTGDYANFKTLLSGSNPEEELQKIFKDSGLTLLRYEFHEDLRYEMRKRQVLEAYSSLDGKYLSLPEDQQKDYMKDFLEIFSEETQIDFVDETSLDEYIKFLFPTVIVHARK